MMGTHDILRSIVVGAGCFSIGICLILLISSLRGYRIPAGVRSVMVGIVLASTGAVYEGASRGGQAYTWRTWIYVAAFACFVFGLSRLFFMVSQANRHPYRTPMIPPEPSANGRPRQPAHV
jgi:hypothetical protein